MSKIKKKDEEEMLIREFFQHLEISVECCRMGDRPDALVKCRLDGAEKYIGVEVTEYQVDAQEIGGSKARGIEVVWTRVRDIIGKKCAAHCQLKQLQVSVFFDAENPPRSREVRSIADELVQFVSGRVPVAANEWLVHSRADLKGYLQLQRCVKYVRVCRQDDGLQGPFLWQYPAAAMVGIVQEVVLRLLKEKTRERKAYCLPDGAECWLVICAGASFAPAASAGLGYSRDELHTPDIRQAALHAGFGRIYFWDRLSRWHERIDE